MIQISLQEIEIIKFIHYGLNNSLIRKNNWHNIDCLWSNQSAPKRKLNLLPGSLKRNSLFSQESKKVK